jgi:hypothetical protein
MAIKYMKIFPIQGPPKFTLNWDFWFEKSRLATLACTFKFMRKNAMLWFSPLNGRGSPFCNLNLFEKIFAIHFVILEKLILLYYIGARCVKTL